MLWLKRIGYALLLWAIMFMWVTILMFVFKIQAGWFDYTITWLGAIIATYFVAGPCKLKNLVDGLLVGVIFLVVGILMDFFVTTKFSPDIFKSWSLWVGYTITLIIPIARASIVKK